MKKESLIEMIRPNPENLNLRWNERRLLILALIKADFKTDVALKLNGLEFDANSYIQMLYSHNLTIRELKKEFKKSKIKFV